VTGGLSGPSSSGGVGSGGSVVGGLVSGGVLVGVVGGGDTDSGGLGGGGAGSPIGAGAGPGSGPGPLPAGAPPADAPPTVKLAGSTVGPRTPATPRVGCPPPSAGVSERDSEEVSEGVVVVVEVVVVAERSVVVGRSRVEVVDAETCRAETDSPSFGTALNGPPATRIPRSAPAATITAATHR
jgi:hypothetical protein